MRCEIDATQNVVRRTHCETCLPDLSCLIEYNPHAYPLVDSFVELKSIRKHRFGTDYVKPGLAIPNPQIENCALVL